MTCCTILMHGASIGSVVSGGMGSCAAVPYFFGGAR
jgi:hypothetical protein